MICECIGALTVIAGEFDEPFHHADASKCIGCRTREVACVVSHQENQDCASLTPETFYRVSMSLKV